MTVLKKIVLGCNQVLQRSVLDGLSFRILSSGIGKRVSSSLKYKGKAQ